MDPTTIAALVAVCFGLYRIIDVAVKVLKIVFLSAYPSNAKELPSLPLTGHAYLFIGSTEAILNRMIELGKMYPTLLRLSSGWDSLFLVTSPEHLKEILCSPKTIEKNYFYDFARPWVGDGLLTAPASIWQVHRKLLQPSFNSVALKTFIETFTTHSVILAKKMEQHVDGPEFVIHRYLSRCTLDAICTTAMGINLASQKTEYCQYEEAAHEVLAGIAKRAVSPWLYPDCIFDRTQLGKNQRKHIKSMHHLVDNVIRQKKVDIARISDQKVSACEEQDSADNSSARPHVLIENLFRLSNDNKMLTDKEVRDHVDTMIVAGSDTTANIVNYLMLMLSSHQDIQEKVYQELCNIFGEHVLDNDSKELHITMEDLTRMTYMERVIKETMRLFPATPAIFRKVSDDLDLGQCTLPRGSSIVLNVMGVHRSEKYWPNPLKFDPDRFLPKIFAKQEPYSYIPFVAGRRNCIGGKYAMSFMKIITTTILGKYVVTKDKVVPVEDFRLKIDFLLKSVNPETLRIKRRPKLQAL